MLYKLYRYENNITLFESDHEQIMNITRIDLHEHFNSQTYDNDIALVTLKRPLSMKNTHIRTACLPTPGYFISSQSLCYVTGWGRLQENGRQQTVLRQAKVLNIISKQVKHNLFIQIIHRKI